MASRYDDALWELVPVDRAPPRDLYAWIESLAPARAALDLGCGDGAMSGAISA